MESNEADSEDFKVTLQLAIMFSMMIVMVIGICIIIARMSAEKLPNESDCTVVATDVQATVVSRTNSFLVVDYLIDIPEYGRATLSCTPCNAIYKEGDVLTGQVNDYKTENILVINGSETKIHKEVNVK